MPWWAWYDVGWRGYAGRIQNDKINECPVLLTTSTTCTPRNDTLVCLGAHITHLEHLSPSV